MTVSHNHLPQQQATFHHDEAAQPEPIIAVWFLHGLPRTSHRKPGQNLQDFCLSILTALRKNAVGSSVSKPCLTRTPTLTFILENWKLIAWKL